MNQDIPGLMGGVVGLTQYCSITRKIVLSGETRKHSFQMGQSVIPDFRTFPYRLDYLNQRFEEL